MVIILDHRWWWWSSSVTNHPGETDGAAFTVVLKIGMAETKNVSGEESGDSSKEIF
jgi:hypothetical protein